MERFDSEDECRSPHRLSLCGKIITFNCRAQVETGGSELVSCSFSYVREDNVFVQAAAAGAAVVGRKASAHVGVVTCDCAVDVQKRATAPCVLVTKRSEKGGDFRYRLLTLVGPHRLEPCMEFRLPYLMEGRVYILRGPTVLWGHDHSVFYTSLQAGGVRQVPLQLSHWVVAELPLHKGQIFVLGVQRPSDHHSATRTLGYFLEDGRVFDGSAIVPHPYVDITRCLSVLSAQSVDGVPRCDAVAATSSRQLVYFQGGTVRDVCELPYEKPQRVQVVHTGRQGTVFVVSFCQGHVCAVWEDTFQIASCWSGVSSVHVDDFLGCGTDQMLLVFGGDAEDSLERFLLTDLCGVSVSRGLDAEAPQTPPPTPETFLLTVRALESRLQSGLSVLHELQQEVRVKRRVLRQSLQTLADAVSQSETALTDHQQEGLVALWERDDEPNGEAPDDGTPDAPAVPPKPRIDKLWHRLAVDHVVVGVTVTTDSSVPPTCLSLSVLTETGRSWAPVVTQTHSQVFGLPPSSSSSSSSSSPSSSSASTAPEPAAKRSRQRDDLDTRRLAVTAVTELTPLLNSGRVKCRVALHYAQRRDALALASRPTPAVLLCGQLDLSVRDDFQTRLLKNPQLKTDEAEEDLLSLLAALDRWVLHIDSPDYSLGDLSGWMQKGVGCERVEVSPEYLLSNSSPPSAVMLLRWHQTTPFQGELSVYSSQLQMLRFLDALSARLPASCSVRRVGGERGRGTARAFASALEGELASLKAAVSPMLAADEEEEEEEEEAGTCEEAPETGSEEGLRRCREAWQQHVERSRRRLRPLVEVGRYRRMIRSATEVRLDADLAALLDAQRTLLG